MSPERDSNGSSSEGTKLGGGAIATLGGLGVLLIFMLQNTEKARLTFLFWDFEWPVWLLVLVSALVGAFVWFGLGVIRRHNRRKERRANR